MAAYRRVYDSRHLQADCQEPGSAPNPTLGNRVWATLHMVHTIKAVTRIYFRGCWGTTQLSCMAEALPHFKVKIGLSVGYANYSFYRTLIPLFVTTKDMGISWIIQWSLLKI